MKLIVAFTYAFILCLISCNRGAEKKPVPEKYLNHTVVRAEKYKSDSLLIVSKLMTELQNQEGFFDNTAYTYDTKVIIDSIIYSPDYKKKTIFVVVRNRTENQLYPNNKNFWYYDGTCYLGTGGNDSLKLYWVGPNFSQSESKEKIASFIREYYYSGYSAGDTTQADYCKYNLDDMRFWTCPIWDKLIQRDIQKKAFEEERIKHPENVYDPKRPRY